MNHKDLIDNYLADSLNVDSTSIIQNNFNPTLTFNRFDVAFKLMYLQSFSTDEKSEFSMKCYKEHLKAFSLGTFREPGNSQKRNFDSYLHVFHQLTSDMKEQGFDPNKSLVPLANDGSILNGAHRTSIGIYLNKQLSVLKTNLPPANFDFKFFKRRGVSNEILDAATQIFIKYDNTCHIALIWPSAEGFDKLLEEKFLHIIYFKQVNLTPKGAHNLISQVYKGETWLGSRHHHFPGIKGKQVQCFAKKGALRVYVFQSNTIDNVLGIKNEIRDIFKIGKHSIHITDTHDEAIELGQLLFNENSIHALNNATLTKYPEITQEICHFYHLIVASSLKTEKFILTPDITMAIYGLKKTSSLDFFTTYQQTITKHLNSPYAKQIELWPDRLSADYILNNPNCYFWYNGLKIYSVKQAAKLISMSNSKNSKYDAKRLHKIYQRPQLSIILSNLQYRYLFMKEKIIMLKKIKLKKLKQYLTKLQ